MAEMLVAQLSSMAQGMTPVEVGGAKLLLVRDGDEVRAFEGLCPHAKAPLDKGALCDGRIICPWHLAAFDARTGALLEPVAIRGLAAYPVRLAGDDLMVELSPPAKPVAPARADPRVFILAGTGAASAMAAVTLRGAGFTGRLLMVGPEKAEPLDRTQFSKMAIGDPGFEFGWLPLVDDATREALMVEREVASVTALGPASKRLTFSNGRVLDYDAALLATGTAPVPLDVPGVDSSHVCLLRTLGDVEAILSRTRKGRHAVVIGTSFIGMEAASALVARGMTVTAVGRDAASPFDKQFGGRVSAAIRALHESKGVSFRLDAAVAHITPDAVILASGESLAADLVVVGIGVRPVLDYADGLARSPDGGLAADRSLRVVEALWAAGDIVMPQGWPRIEHWRLAQQHGQTAALAMLGQQAEYDGVPFFWSAQHGKRLDYIGHAPKWDEVVFDGDVEGFAFIAWYLADGVVLAALTCAHDRATALLSQALRSPLPLSEARRLVA